MKPIDEYLRSLSSTGKLDPENGQFTIDPWKAARSLGEFQLRSFENCLLKFVQAHMADPPDPPQKLEFDIRRRGPFVVDWPSRGYKWLTLDNVVRFNSLLTESENSENRAARHFAVGLAGLLSSKGVTRVDVTTRAPISPMQYSGGYVRFDSTGGVDIEEQFTGKPKMQIWREDPEKALFSLLRRQKIDRPGLLRRVQYAPYSVYINGESSFEVEGDHQDSDFYGLILVYEKIRRWSKTRVGSMTLSPKRPYGVCEIEGLGTSPEFAFEESIMRMAVPICMNLSAIIHYKHKESFVGSTITWVEDGVCIETTPLDSPGGHKVFASSSLLKKDLSGFGVVKDDIYDRAVSLLVSIIAHAPSKSSDTAPFINTPSQL